MLNEHEAGLTLAKSRKHQELLKQKGVFLLLALSEEDTPKHVLILKSRSEPQGVPAEKLRIRNLGSFDEGPKVENQTE